MLTGTPNMYTPFILQLDLKFFDLFTLYFLFNPSSIFYRVDNDPLIRSIKKYWYPNAPPIKTSFDAKQPRLLLVSIDLENCTSSTFDNYEKGKMNMEMLSAERCMEKTKPSKRSNTLKVLE